MMGFAFTGFIGDNIQLPVILFTCIFSPFVEEFQFRGFGYLLLKKYSHWSFCIACIPQAIIFGLVHLEKGSNLEEMCLILSLLFSGGVIFAWLLEQWQNLWIPFTLHAFMNLWWALFSVSDTAIGGWLPFAMQIMTLTFSVMLTFVLKKRGYIKHSSSCL